MVLLNILNTIVRTIDLRKEFRKMNEQYSNMTCDEMAWQWHLESVKLEQKQKQYWIDSIQNNFINYVVSFEDTIKELDDMKSAGLIYQYEYDILSEQINYIHTERTNIEPEITEPPKLNILEILLICYMAVVFLPVYIISEIFCSDSE